jgi:hypothetical protein
MLSLPSAWRSSLDCQYRTCPVFVFLRAISQLQTATAEDLVKRANSKV